MTAQAARYWYPHIGGLSAASTTTTTSLLDGVAGWPCGKRASHPVASHVADPIKGVTAVRRRSTARALTRCAAVMPTALRGTGPDWVRLDRARAKLAPLFR